MSKRRNNSLSPDLIPKKDINYEQALGLFIQDCETRHLRPYTIDYYVREINAFYKRDYFL
ncbi:hypothetical protein [Bacillus sp. SD088]|uniref:hypothetical protein n=1 Tax=Bacillus sp. SD088 TaxID=2782012 RepID=UPI001A964656|nr:hypothetical protein [Bacillus sp. SD088]MBO0995932.1 hypothetical protein [Bacillus sp. SD088]